MKATFKLYRCMQRVKLKIYLLKLKIRNAKHYFFMRNLKLFHSVKNSCCNRKYVLGQFLFESVRK
jgi:hypothetical protein